MGVFNFTTGLNRLDFDRVENRPFFLALHRQVACVTNSFFPFRSHMSSSDLQRRGCVRTSFEFARLLYGLDPWNDPHGAIFHLEYLAIKANMHQWLLDMYDNFADLSTSDDKDARLNPSLLPGWAYARALVLRLMEDTTQEKVSCLIHFHLPITFLCCRLVQKAYLHYSRLLKISHLLYHFWPTSWM